MTLVVETGTGVDPTANSYADLDFIRAYNVARGRTDFEDTPEDDALEALAIQAMDFIEALEPNMQGSRVFGVDQPLSWPRSLVYLFGDLFAEDAIPVQLANAQSELVWQISEGVVLFPTATGQAIKRKKLGPLEKEFFAPAEQPSMPYVDQWLAMLLLPTSRALRVTRI